MKHITILILLYIVPKYSSYIYKGCQESQNRHAVTIINYFMDRIGTRHTKIIQVITSCMQKRESKWIH